MSKFGVDFTAFNISEVLILFLYIIGFVFLSNKLGKRSKFKFNLFLGISILHLLMTFAYWLYTFNNTADSYFYYSVANSINYNEWLNYFGKQDTQFIIFIVYPLIHILNLSYIGVFLFFSFIGLLGFYLLIKIIDHFIIIYNVKINQRFYYLLLLPGVHFWSCAIGKDSLIFYFIVLFLYSLFKKKWLLILFASAGIFYVRSHILLLILSGLLLSLFLFRRKLSLIYRILILSLIAIAIIVIVPLVFERFGVDSINSTNDLIENQLSKNQEGTSSVDMSNSSFIIKFISYLFRPFFFDVNSLTSLVSSFENIIWVFMIFKIVSNYFKIKKNNISNYYSPLIFIGLTMVIALSSILNNFGIAVRQKTMIYPIVLILLFLSLISIKLNTIKNKEL